MDLFDITDEEIKQLKTIVTEGEAEERDRKRHRKYADRTTYLEIAEQRRIEARLRRARGESLRQIAEALGVSHEGVRKMLKD